MEKHTEAGRDKSTVKMYNSSHVLACFVLRSGIKVPFCSGEKDDEKNPTCENFNSGAAFLKVSCQNPST